MGDFVKGLAGLFAVLVLGGCSSAERRLLFYGSDPQIDPAKASLFADRQEAIVTQIGRAAGIQKGVVQLQGPPANAWRYNTSQWSSSEWKVFVRSGINYVDTQCNEYLEALNRFYRAKNTTKQQFVLASAATLGIMGAVNVAAQALAITGIAFGFAAASVDNLAGGLIYELPAADVTQLVRSMQLTYKLALPAQGYEDQPAAYAAIQGYITICLQSSIETQVANAVKRAEIDVKPGDSATGTSPVVQVGPITTFSYSENDSTKLLNNYIFKADGSVDRAKWLEVDKAIKAEGFEKKLDPFDLLAGYPKERDRVVKRLGLK